MGNGQSGGGSAKGTPTLYIHGLSAPARAAWMTTKAAEIPVHLKYIDPFKGEHKTPEFAKVWMFSNVCGWFLSGHKS